MSISAGISYEQMRSLLLEVLAAAPGGQLGSSLRERVATAAANRGLVSHGARGLTGSTPGIFSVGSSTPSISDKDWAKVISIWWDLCFEGVVRPGANDGLNNNLPFFHVTDWGKERIKDPATPYDPDGYLSRLRKAIPDVDPIILTYLEESLKTFRIGCLLASTIALGCASEKAFVLLVKAYGDSLSGAAQTKFREKTEGRVIKRQFDEFMVRVDGQLRANLPGDLAADLDVTLSGVFTLIRNQRNEAGHPTGRTIDREQAYANLLLFPTYAKHAYQLIAWLKAKAQ